MANFFPHICLRFIFLEATGRMLALFWWLCF
jgi:hypothetical protein